MSENNFNKEFINIPSIYELHEKRGKYEYKYYRIYYHIDGVGKRTSKRFKSREEAERYLKDVLLQ